MEFIYLFVFVLCFVYFIPFRLVVLHPIKTLRYGVKDTYEFFRYAKWRVLSGGVLNCYGAHFGGGKTLTLAHFAVKLFEKYNNVKVFDFKRMKWVTQKLHVLSNFELCTIPFEPLTSLSQIEACARFNASIDEANDTRTVTLVLVDEASVQFNSRNFKSNIDALFLNTLLTCRHYHISMWYSSQKFKLSDALLRSVTQRYINCSKLWRFMRLNEYSADEVEYATNPTLVKPLRRYGYFIEDKDFASYDTLAVVDALNKSVKEGDMMSEKEILEMRGEINPNDDGIVNFSRKGKKHRKVA